MSRVWLGTRRTMQDVGFGLAVVVTAMMLGLAWVAPATLQRLEHLSLNVRFMLRGERPPGDEVVLVAVDERSLKELGRWPWSRDKQARVVEGVAQDGAKVIGLDLMYSEPEATDYHLSLAEIRSLAKAPNGAAPALRQLLAQKLAQADPDRQFTQSLHNAKTVVLALPLDVPEIQSAGLGAPAVTGPPAFILRHQFMLVRGVSGGEPFEPYRATGLLPPLKAFADEAVSLGHVSSPPDPDGVTRYAPLAIRYGGRRDYYPSFALEIARIYLGISRDRMALALGQGVLLGDLLIPTDQKARLLINYVGRARSFRSVSATDVIHQRIPPGTFTGKAVLVGASALATYDQKVTPFSANLPGLELNATVVDNILHGPFLLKPLWSGPIDLTVVLLLGLGLGAVLTRLRALPGALVSLAALLGYLAAAQYVFVVHGLWLDVVSPVLTLVSVFLVITVMRFMTEERKTREIRALFSNYVSPLIVEELIKDPRKATLGGSRKELTMLFSDVAGFTTFSEKHAAEDVVAQLNEYLGAMSEVIIRWNGTLDKFVGDAIVAYWGAPVEQPDHVELAIKCALHMRKRLAELQDKWRAEDRVPFESGVGINTGVAVVGNIGAEGKKMDYTMIGDQVNLAARIQGLTRTFGCPIVITEFTASRLKDLIGDVASSDNKGRLGHVALRKLGTVRVKGKAQTVVAYGLESLRRDEASRIDELEPIAASGEPFSLVTSHRAVVKTSSA